METKEFVSNQSQVKVAWDPQSVDGLLSNGSLKET